MMLTPPTGSNFGVRQMYIKNPSPHQQVNTAFRQPFAVYVHASSEMGSKGGGGGGLFRYADRLDRLLMFFGALGSIGDGIMTPLVLWVLSGLINEYGGGDVSFSNKVVDKVSIFSKCW